MVIIHMTEICKSFSNLPKLNISESCVRGDNGPDLLKQKTTEGIDGYDTLASCPHI